MRRDRKDGFFLKRFKTRGEVLQNGRGGASKREGRRMEMGREVLHNFLFVNDAKIQHSNPEVKF